MRRSERSTCRRSISAAVVGMLSTALAKARAICGRASTTAPGRRHVGLEAERIEDDDQAFEFGGEQIELLVQRREEFGLPSDPGSDVSLWRFGHAGIHLGRKTNQRSASEIRRQYKVVKSEYDATT